METRDHQSIPEAIISRSDAKTGAHWENSHSETCSLSQSLCLLGAKTLDRPLQYFLRIFLTFFLPADVLGISAVHKEKPRAGMARGFALRGVGGGRGLTARDAVCV